MQPPGSNITGDLHQSGQVGTEVQKPLKGAVVKSHRVVLTEIHPQVPPFLSQWLVLPFTYS